jgi:hypothetical protein
MPSNARKCCAHGKIDLDVVGLLRAQSKAASFSNFIFIFSNSKSHPDRASQGASIPPKKNGLLDEKQTTSITYRVLCHQ